MSSEYEALEARLVAAGAPASASKGPLDFTGPIEILVNTSHSAGPYEGLLVEAFPSLSGNELEMVVRALSERGMKRAGPALATLMASDTSPSTPGLLWAIGNALNTINDPRTYPAVLGLCADGRLGTGRQMLFAMLPRIRSEAAYRCALAGLNDLSVRGHAIEAVGKFGRIEALTQLEGLETKAGLYEHKAKTTAIRRLKSGAEGRAR